MPESLRHPLTLQVAVRLALALLVTLLATIALTLWFYGHANLRSLEHHLHQAEKHFSGALALRESDWERGAYNFKARLEFSRVLEDPAGRQGRLGTFITAQGGVPEYPLVLVLDREGNRLAWFAYAGDSIPPAVFDSGDAGWAYDTSGNRLYRVFRQQVWLGSGQNGMLLTFRHIDHALLGTLAYPETDLVALWRNRPVASSLGDDGMNVADRNAVPAAATQSSLLPWNLARPDSLQVKLVVHPDEPFALRELFQPMALGALAFAAAAWIVFGIWVTALVRRILSLGAAQREFADAGTVSPLVITALNRAEPGRGDELGELSRSLLEMMGSVSEHRRAQEQAAEVLRLSEERFRFLVESVNVVAWEFSTEKESFTYV